MNTEDVPSPIDFHIAADVHAWIEQTIQTRPYRSTFFNEFVTQVSQLEPGPLSVLELGSGTGMLAEQILSRCPSVHAYTLLDFSEPMLAVSRERLSEFAARARYERADFRDDDWIARVGGVDAVFSMQAVHEVRHKLHVPALYRKVRSVLNPGG